MEDIEAFTLAYTAKLDEAELAKFVPEDISLEVPFFLYPIKILSSYDLRKTYGTGMMNNI